MKLVEDPNPYFTIDKEGNKFYTLDGKYMNNLENFYDQVSTRVLKINGESGWGRNLDAFNDILSGGWNAEPPYTIIWKNSEMARKSVGDKTFDI